MWVYIYESMGGLVWVCISLWFDICLLGREYPLFCFLITLTVTKWIFVLYMYVCVVMCTYIQGSGSPLSPSFSVLVKQVGCPFCLFILRKLGWIYIYMHMCVCIYIYKHGVGFGFSPPLVRSLQQVGCSPFSWFYCNIGIVICMSGCMYVYMHKYGAEIIGWATLSSKQ